MSHEYKWGKCQDAVPERRLGRSVEGKAKDLTSRLHVLGMEVCGAWESNLVMYGLVGLCKDFGFYSERNGKPSESYTHSHLMKSNKIIFC